MIITEEDGFVCTGAATAYLNLGLFLIQRCGSEDLAKICAKVLPVDLNRTIQAPYFFRYELKNHKDTAIETAQWLIDKNFAGYQYNF